MEQGIIIKIKEFNEKDAFIKVFTSLGGLKSGFVKNAITKKNSNIYQIGNLVNFTWTGREGSLGGIKAEIVKPYGTKALFTKVGTLCLSSACDLLNSMIGIHDDKTLYSKMLAFLQLLQLTNDEEKILNCYLDFERTLILNSGEIEDNSFEKKEYYIILQNILNYYNKKLTIFREMLEGYIK